MTEIPHPQSLYKEWKYLEEVIPSATEPHHGKDFPPRAHGKPGPHLTPSKCGFIMHEVFLAPAALQRKCAGASHH